MKRIFIGSSFESLHVARHLADALKEDPELCPVLWTEVFNPGILTLEAIERESRRLSGAIMLATPDDTSTIKGRDHRVPRTNVMIEFGYFCAMLGREKIALCKFDDVNLATDLAGMTYLDMGAYHENSPVTINADIIPRIKVWAKSLPDIVEGLPCVNVLHGYSGRWRVIVPFEKWRGHNVEFPDYAQVTGELVLHIPLGEDQYGFGCVYGTLSVYVQGIEAEFLVTDSVSKAEVSLDGTLTFHSHTFNRQRIRPREVPEGIEGFKNEIAGPHLFEWSLKPVNPRKLEGKYIAWLANQPRSQSLKVTADRL